MRKYLLIVLLSAVTLPAIAQKGSTLLYGSLGYQYMENSPFGGSGSIFSINPGIGYGLSDRWTAGVNLTFRLYNGHYESTSFGAGPFVRYTRPLSEMFSVFGQFDAGYSIEKVEGNQQTKTLTMALFPAIEMNIKNGFALNFSMGGLDFTSGSSAGIPGSSKSFSIQFGSSANFGVSKRFGVKK